MFVKKFEAPSLEKALQLVKEELGPNALVLSTTQSRRKWFQKPVVEVTAAGSPSGGAGWGRAAEKRPADSQEREFDEEALAKVFPHRKKRTDSADRSYLNGAEALLEKESEPTVPAPVNRYAALDTKTPAPGPVVPRTAREPMARAERYEESFRRAGFSESSAKELTRRLIFDYPREDRTRPSQLLNAKTKLVAQDIRTLSCDSLLLHPAWTAIGVGGSGKTSCLVKLALAFKAQGNASVLVAGDRRKIAGRAELAGYARLIKAGFAFEAKAVEAGKGVQLIDSPALEFDRSDSLQLEKLCRDSKTILVLDASQRLEEMIRIVERTEKLAPAAVVFTKLDVASQFGAIFDVLRHSRLPLLGASVSPSFKVPFRFFEPLSVASLILKGQKDG